MPLDTPPAPESDGSDGKGRDSATGRFKPGNRLGKGNPHARRLAELRTAFTAEIQGDDLRQLARKLHELAVAGDVPAANLLLAYCLGKPRHCVDPDDLDRAELQSMIDRPREPEILQALLKGIDPAGAIEILRRLLDDRDFKAQSDSLFRPVNLPPREDA